MYIVCDSANKILDAFLTLEEIPPYLQSYTIIQDSNYTSILQVVGHPLATYVDGKVIKPLTPEESLQAQITTFQAQITTLQAQLKALADATGHLVV